MFLPIFCAAFVVGSLFGGSEADHFRGGYISWTPVAGQERQVKVHFRVAYRNPWFSLPENSEYGEDCTKALEESRTPIPSGWLFNVFDGDDVVAPLFGGKSPLYTCKDIEIQTGGWSSGFNETIITLPEQDSQVWTVGSDDCCWVKTLKNYKSPRRWRIRTMIDLRPRADNGLVNTSPRTDGLPIKTVLRSCYSSINIATNDPDGDRVKCRWTSEKKAECDTNCGNPDEDIFTMKSGECKILVDASGAVPGWYAVAVIVEDFLPKSEQRGNRGRKEKALSSISYQFLVNIIDKDVDCDRVTVTPPSQCIAVPFRIFPPYTLNLHASTTSESVPIVDITMVSQPGMSKSDLIDDGGGNYHVVLSYTPSVDANGKVNTLCYQAVDEEKIVSEEACLKFFVGGTTPEPISLLSTPTSNLSDPVDLSTETWKLYFTERVQLSEEEPNNAAVTFLFMNGTVAHEVTLNDANANVSTEEPYFVSFTTPGFELVADTNYTIQLAKGVVTGTEGCLVPSDPAEWQFLTSSRGEATRNPPTIIPEVSLECTPTYMTAYIEKESSDLPNFDLSILSFNDPDCSATEYNESHIAVRTMYGKCGTEAIPNEDHSRVSMVNNIYIPQAGSFVYPDVGEPILIRDQAYRVRVNCSIPAQRLAYVEFTTNSSTIDIEEDVVGDSEFSLKMYKDDTYSRPFYSFGDFPIATEATQSDALYFEARTFNPNPKFLPFLEECVATPRMVTSDSLQYPLIRNGCPLDYTVRFDDAPARRVRFSFEPFTFLGHNQPDSIFVHCQMRDCNSRRGDCDPTNCPDISAPSFF